MTATHPLTVRIFVRQNSASDWGPVLFGGDVPAHDGAFDLFGEINARLGWPKYRVELVSAQFEEG